MLVPAPTPTTTTTMRATMARQGAGLLADAGAEDGEHPQSQRRQSTGPNIQRSLTRAADKCVRTHTLEYHDSVADRKVVTHATG